MCDKRDKAITINDAIWDEPLCAQYASKLLTLLIKSESIVYGIMGVERGTRNDRLHIQGFIQATKKTGDVWWAKHINDLIGKYPHVKTRVGAPSDLKSYIEEPEKHEKPPSYAIYQIGTFEPGRASALPFRTLVEHVKSKKITFNELKEQYTAEYLIHYRQFDRLQRMLLPKKRQFEKEVHYLYGPSGTGKSRKAFEMANLHGDGDYYCWSLEEDGQSYNGEGTIIFDDFRGEVPYSTLLRLLDRYPFSIRIKGDTAILNQATLIIFTSDRHFSELYPGETWESRKQLERRITKVQNFCINGPMA